MAMGLHLSAGWAWVSALVYVFGAATTSVGLARRLPLQNVLAVTFVIVGVAAVATMLGAKLHKPFGDFEPSDTSGSLVVGKLFWFIPLFWLIMVVSSRYTAKLVLRPWRRAKNYGLWLIGLTGILAALFDMSFDPFATGAAGYWTWKSPQAGWSWYGAPWTNVVSVLVLAMIMTAIATPWLLIKRPTGQANDLHCLWVWLAFQGYFALGNALHARWSAAGVGVASCVALAVLAWRGHQMSASRAGTGGSGRDGAVEDA